ncbi:MAG: RcpC/CpaB family pilus assembly protein [Pseudomonas marincola]
MAVYLAVQVFEKTDVISANAHAEPALSVHLPSLKKATSKGEIVPMTDVVWIPYSGNDDLAGLINQSNILKTKADYFSVNRSVEAGEILKRDDFLWPTDKRFLENILKPDFRAVEVSFIEGLLEKKTLTSGNFVDLLWSNKKANDSFIVAQNIRVLAVHPDGDGNCIVLLEVSTAQSEIISVSRSLGSVSLLLRSKNRNEKDKNLKNVLQRLRLMGAETGALPLQSEAKILIIQRGEKITVMNRTSGHLPKTKTSLFAGVTERGLN